VASSLNRRDRSGAARRPPATRSPAASDSSSQGWDKFDFNYTDDSKVWFNDASWSIVEPYVGGSVGAAFPDDDNGLEPSQVLSR
jgi:hypothetical protein